MARRLKSPLNTLYTALGHVEPAHISLYAWFLMGKIWVIVSGKIPLPQEESPIIRTAWVILGLLCPAMLFLAYWLIYQRPGKPRYVGFWMRLGADVAQFLATVIFLLGLLTEAFGADIDGHHIFSAFLVAAILCFLGAMIVRDVLALARTEQLAWHLRDDE